MPSPTCLAQSSVSSVHSGSWEIEVRDAAFDHVPQSSQAGLAAFGFSLVSAEAKLVLRPLAGRRELPADLLRVLALVVELPTAASSGRHRTLRASRRESPYRTVGLSDCRTVGLSDYFRGRVREVRQTEPPKTLRSAAIMRSGRKSSPFRAGRKGLLKWRRGEWLGRQTANLITVFRRSIYDFGLSQKIWLTVSYRTGFLAASDSKSDLRRPPRACC